MYVWKKLYLVYSGEALETLDDEGVEYEIVEDTNSTYPKIIKFPNQEEYSRANRLIKMYAEDLL